jgi:hypothetical protein
MSSSRPYSFVRPPYAHMSVYGTRSGRRGTADGAGHYDTTNTQPQKAEAGELLTPRFANYSSRVFSSVYGCPAW